MPSKSFRDAIVALLALVMALAAAYGLDHGLFLLRQLSSYTFNFSTFIWLSALANLLLADGLVALVWWLATCATFPRIVDVVFVLVGVAAVLIIPAVFTLQLSIPLFESGLVSYWNSNSGLLAMAGLFHLFWRRASDRVEAGTR